jgi:hypothetical protein
MTDFNALFSDLNIGGLGKMVKTLNYGRDGLGRPLGSRLEEDKFYFKVAEFSMGSMAPKSDAYYEVRFDREPRGEGDKTMVMIHLG